MTAWLQRVGTATPRHDVHQAFVDYARTLLRSERDRLLLEHMAEHSGITHRYSVLEPAPPLGREVDAGGFYRAGDFPSTAARLALYDDTALALALHAVQALAPADDLAALLARVNQVVVASATGFAVPGLDVRLVDALGLPGEVQRTVVGCMGCAVALPALRMAQQAVQADPEAQVLVVNVEICSLHLHESRSPHDLLSFLLFGDGASAALVGAEPVGAELLDFHSCLLPDSRDLIAWDLGDQGLEIHQSSLVPARIAQVLVDESDQRARSGLLGGETASHYALWAVNGERDVLDALQAALALPAAALADSRAVLQAVGNVASASVMFVLRRMLARARPGAQGIALAFGPGLAAESMHFRVAGLA
jgi:predicted naringenin-chalcone synthase